MVQSRFRGKDDCVYCDQPLLGACLFVCLAGGVFLCSVEQTGTSLTGIVIPGAT